MLRVVSYEILGLQNYVAIVGRHQKIFFAAPAERHEKCRCIWYMRSYSSDMINLHNTQVYVNHIMIE